MKQILTSEHHNLSYWNEFYKKVKIQEESSFCSFLKTMIQKNSLVMDVGCGSGRDTYSFAKDGYEVIAMDRSEEAIKLNRSLREELNINESQIEFFAVDIGDERSLAEIVQRANDRAVAAGKMLVVYVRFVLHSINELTETILLTVMSKCLKKGDYFAAEFRTVEDQQLDKVYNDHYRRFIAAEKLVSDLETLYGFRKLFFYKGTGLSIFNNEDPYLGRIVMEKN